MCTFLQNAKHAGGNRHKVSIVSLFCPDQHVTKTSFNLVTDQSRASMQSICDSKKYLIMKVILNSVESVWFKYTFHGRQTHIVLL